MDKNDNTNLYMYVGLGLRMNDSPEKCTALELFKQQRSTIL